MQVWSRVGMRYLSLLQSGGVLPWRESVGQRSRLVYCPTGSRLLFPNGPLGVPLKTAA